MARKFRSSARNQSLAIDRERFAQRRCLQGFREIRPYLHHVLGIDAKHISAALRVYVHRSIGAPAATALRAPRVLLIPAPSRGRASDIWSAQAELPFEVCWRGCAPTAWSVSDLGVSILGCASHCCASRLCLSRIILQFAAANIISEILI